MRANKEAADARRLRYFADMLQVPQAWDSGNIRRLNELLAETAGNENRGFEWHYWHRLAHLDLPPPVDLSPERKPIVSADGGRVLALNSSDWILYDRGWHPTAVCGGIYKAP